MIVTTLSPLALPAPDDDPDRPKGLHVSQIISDMMKKLDPKRYDKHDKFGKPIPMDMAKVEAGQTYEQRLELMLKKDLALPGLFRPPPLKVDGVWMSPDGLIPGHAFLDNNPDLPPALWAEVPWSWVVVEYKLSWYSERKPCPEDKVFVPWLWQMKAYCKGTGTRFGLLIPQFMNGNYAPPSPTAPVPRFLEWTPMEIEENWSMLLNHAKSMGWL